MKLNKFEFNIGKCIQNLYAQILTQSSFTKELNLIFNLQVSGGKDSMCLLEVYFRLKNQLKIFPLAEKIHIFVQHFDHEKRGIESTEDAIFVSESAQKKGFICYTERLSDYHQMERESSKNTFSDNFQNSARMWRLELAQKRNAEIRKILEEQNPESSFFSITVKAHHGRDQVETFLQHIIRGSGLNGLQGMKVWEQKLNIYRPFLPIFYQDLETYAKERDIAFREDSSNAMDDYSRNYIRHHVLPHLYHLNPRIEAAVERVTQQTQEHFMNYQRSFENVVGGEEREKANVTLKDANEKGQKKSMMVTPETSTFDIYIFAKQNFPETAPFFSENSLKNILHEVHILFKLSTYGHHQVQQRDTNSGHIKDTQDFSSKRFNNLEKIVYLKKGYAARLRLTSQGVCLNFESSSS